MDKYKKKYIFIICSTILFNLNLFSNYISVDEYISSYPEEKILMNKFVSVVNNKAVPLSIKNKKVKIAMLYPSLQLSDYWRRNKIAFEKRLVKLNINYDLDLLKTTNISCSKKQSKFIEQIIKEKYDFFITTLNSDLEKNLIRKVLVLTKTKVILQNITTPIIEWKKTQPLIYIGFDHKIGSLKLANYYKNKFKDGKYAVMFHTDGYVSQMRGDTFISYMNNNSDLKLVDSYYTNGDKNRAYEATLDLLKKHKDLRFIYACATDIAIGVSNAVESLGLQDKILVNGWGGGSAELKMLSNSKLDVTVMRMNDDAGIVMAEVIKSIILKEKTPKIFSGQIELIDKKTLKVDIELLKKKSFRYSNENNK